MFIDSGYSYWYWFWFWLWSVVKKLASLVVILENVVVAFVGFSSCSIALTSGPSAVVVLVGFSNSIYISSSSLGWWIDANTDNDCILAWSSALCCLLLAWLAWNRNPRAWSILSACSLSATAAAEWAPLFSICSLGCFRFSLVRFCFLFLYFTCRIIWRQCLCAWLPFLWRSGRCCRCFLTSQRFRPIDFVLGGQLLGGPVFFSHGTRPRFFFILSNILAWFFTCWSLVLSKVLLYLDTRLELNVHLGVACNVVDFFSLSSCISVPSSVTISQFWVS